jgi:hypothetical protein
MKNFAIVTLAFALAGCSSSAPDAGNGAEPSDPPTSSPPVRPATGAWSIIGPFAHENLEVFLFEEKEACPDDPGYIILEEALKEGTLRVTEQSGSAQVNLLEIENVGEHPVYIQAGDTVKGGQQDRTIAVDFIVPPKSGKMSIGAFCVEPGRWATRTYSETRTTTNQFGGIAFSLSEVPAATKEQKLAIRLEKNQARVWAAGRAITEREGKSVDLPIINGLPSVGSSYVLATETPDLQKKIAEYVEALRDAVKGKHHLVGMAFAVNGEPDTIDLYGSPRLFLKLWPKLLRGAALEAITKKESGGAVKSVPSNAFGQLLEGAEHGERREKSLAGDLREVVTDGSRAVVFDSVKKGTLLHRQVIAKE